MASIIHNSSCHSFENECRKIHDSWGRLTLNQLVQTLASRSQNERQQIRETYKGIYGEDLVNCLTHVGNEAAVSPNMCAALSMWMLDPHERNAVIAREALQQVDTNYKALVEIFVGRKSSHIMLIKQAYQSRYKRPLDQDIINIEPLHPCQKILVAISTSHKAHQADVSLHIAKCDAKRFYETGVGNSGAIEEAVVLETLSKRSIPQMKLTLSRYKHIYGHEYTKTLKGNSQEFEDSLKMVIKCMYKTPEYYAKTLYSITKGTATDNGTLARVLVSRAEIDMEEIQGVFKKKYGMELRDAICERFPSGDFRDFLISLATKPTTTAVTMFSP